MAIFKRASSSKKAKAPTAVKNKTSIIKQVLSKVKATGKRAKKPERPASTTEMQEVEESKYYTGPGPVIQKFVEEKPFEFPVGYDDNRIVLMIRDPHWLHAYWEVNGKRRKEIISELGEETFNLSRLLLRVYDTENWNSYDLEVSGGSKNWYIRVPSPNRTYCVDIGFMTPDGRFITAARSNWVTMPRDQMSEVIDEQWMIPDWEKIYALSGGFGIGRGSEEIREMMKRRLQEESASGWVSSISSPMRIPVGKERPFWLVANAELIVYGATEPTATVTLQGRKIKLREDGSFSVRFALPDGKQVIPVEATRDDGMERRKITPIVERNTE